MNEQPLDLRTVTGLFGEASPYGAQLYGQQLGNQDRMRPMEERKTLAETLGKELENKKAEDQVRLNEATFGERVKKIGLENQLQEETIIGKRKENWAKEFENMTKNLLGPEFYADNERYAQYKKKIEHMQSSYETLGQAAQQIENAPILARYSLLTKYARDIGLKEEQIAALLEVPPERLPEVMRAMAEKTAKMAPEFMRQQALEQLKHKNAMELAKLKGQIERGIQELKNAGDVNLKTLDAAIVRYTELAAKLPEGHPERERAIAMANQYIAIKQAVPEAKAMPQTTKTVDDKGREKIEHVGPTTPSSTIGEPPAAPASPFYSDMQKRKDLQKRQSLSDPNEIMKNLGF